MQCEGWEERARETGREGRHGEYWSWANMLLSSLAPAVAAHRSTSHITAGGGEALGPVDRVVVH